MHVQRTYRSVCERINKAMVSTYYFHAVKPARNHFFFRVHLKTYQNVNVRTLRLRDFAIACVEIEWQVYPGGLFQVHCVRDERACLFAKCLAWHIINFKINMQNRSAHIVEMRDRQLARRHGHERTCN